MSSIAATSEEASQPAKSKQIIRTRTGCMTCRKRKTKCDEQRPRCKNCQRLNLECEGYQQPYRFVNLSKDRAAKRRKTYQVASDLVREEWAERELDEQDQGLSSHNSEYDEQSTRHTSIDVLPTVQDTLLTGSRQNATSQDHCSTSEIDADGMDQHRGTLDLQDVSLYGPDFHISENRPISNYTLPSAPAAFVGPGGSGPMEHSTLAQATSATRNIPDSSPASAIIDAHETPIDQALSDLGGKTPYWRRLLDEPHDGNSRPAIATIIVQRGAYASDGHISTGASDGILLGHWRRNVLDVLPDAFRSYNKILQEFPPFGPALLALSASHLSQVQTSLIDCPDQCRKVAVPSMELQNQSREYYTTAIGMLTTIGPVTIQSRAPCVLVTLLAFAYTEHVTGSFGKFDTHLRGLEQLVTSEGKTIMQRHLGIDMISAWLKLRAVNWWQQAFYAVESFNVSLEAMSVRPAIDALLLTRGFRQDAILIHMVESRRVSSMLLMERFFGRGGSDTLSSRCCANHYATLEQPSPEKPWRSMQPIRDQDWVKELRKLAQKLDDWHDALKVRDLPNENLTPDRVEPLHSGRAKLKISPLKFQSHTAAMDYARFVLSQVLIDQSIIEELTSATPSPRNCDQISPWMLLFLRITAGLDFSDCISQNVYTVGISSMLIECVLRNMNPAVDVWVSEWLRQLESTCVYQEGSLEVCDASATVEKVREERLAGRDVFGIFPETGENDFINGVFTTKNIPTVIYGRDRQTGNLFCQRTGITLFRSYSNV